MDKPTTNGSSNLENVVNLLDYDEDDDDDRKPSPKSNKKETPTNSTDVWDYPGEDESEDEGVGANGVDAPGLQLTRHRSKNRSKTTTATTSKKAVKRPAGEQTLARLIEEAVYEIENDPYRGIASFTSTFPHKEKAKTSQDDEEHDDDDDDDDDKMDVDNMEEAENDEMDVDMDETTENDPTKDKKQSPWMLSCRPDPSREEDEAENANGVSAEESMVYWACHSRCPTLIQWTVDAVEKSRKKKKRKAVNGSHHSTSSSSSPPLLGQRPEGQSIRCRCDANPFCLATLGGAMNDVNLRELNRYLDQTSGNGRMEAPASTKNGLGRARSASTDDDDDDDDVVVVDEDKDKRRRPGTREMLKNVRGSVTVPESRIRAYLIKTLQGLANTKFIDECLERIREHHRKIRFVNPVDGDEPPRTSIELSLPPGIENLGATCYLNTQLQCLAQNLVFLKGLFTWKPSEKLKEKQDRMTKVLTLFQTLLVDLNAGPNNRTTTEEFSNSLGLDRFEQQDPNEFSRLFLERMQESFKQGEKEGKIEADGAGHSDLVNLLPTLFHGMSRYETTCQHCKTVSTRNEEFSDLNLNIAKPPEEKKKKGQQLLVDLCSSKKKVDVDVQMCLDRYCQPETLSGDNQYQCSFCNAKRDATRRLLFQKLPPVLNVLLSRYIYDIGSGSKKKITDKVLLPETLVVEEMPQQSAKAEKKRYVLCAVMSHRGKSAYSGHYTAEARCWISGQWFYFNDEEVSLLKSGPSSSFDPEKDNEKKKLQGSEDAYNLYYVEEGFLAHNVFEFFKGGKEKLPDVLVQAAMARSERYADLSQLLLQDEEIFHKLEKRQELILKKIFPPNYTASLTVPSSEYLWVPADFLRRFLSCEKSLEDEMTDPEFRRGVKASHHACMHGESCLSPRTARKGKLIPEQMFASLLEVIREETGGNDEVAWHEMAIPAAGIVCTECAISYRNEMEPKVDELQQTKFLYQTFVEKKEEVSEGDEELHLIPTKFISSFQKHFENSMKRSTKADATGDPDIIDLVTHAEFPGEGIDALDFVFVSNLQDDYYTTASEAIICAHGNLKNNWNKRCARRVAPEVWEHVRLLFPAARDFREGSKCDLCEHDDFVDDVLRETVSTMAKDSYKPLKDRTLTVQQFLDLPDDRKVCRLVHIDNVKALGQFYNSYKRNNTSNATFSAEKIKGKIEDIFLSKKQFHLALLPEADATDTPAKFFFPLVCEEHCKPMKSAIINTNEEEGEPRLLNEKLQLMENTEFDLFAKELTSVAMLYDQVCKIVEESERSKKSTLQFQEIGNIKQAAVDFCIEAQTERSFPIVTQWSPSTSSKYEIRRTEAKNGTVSLEIDDVCCDRKCNSAFTEWLAAISEEKGKGSNGEALSKDDPISIIDDDDNNNSDSLEVEVVKLVDDHASDDIIASALNTKTPGVRRSSRKRKNRDYGDAIYDHQSIHIDFSKNLASLRLHIMQQCNDETEVLGNSLKLFVWPKLTNESMVDIVDLSEEDMSETHKVSVVELPFSSNEKSLVDICREKVQFKINDAQIFLVRYGTTDPTAAAIPKDQLMDSLFSLSDIAASPPSNKKENSSKNKTKKKERGFTGTFLTSSLSDGVADSASPPTEKKSAMKSNSSPKKARFADEKVVIDDSPPRDTAISVQSSSSSSASSPLSSPPSPQNSGDGLAFAVAKLLMDNPMVQGNEYNCVKAAKWACQENPSETVAENLQDQALAKALECSYE